LGGPSSTNSLPLECRSALTHRSEAEATLPATVEVVTGDLTVPDSLDAALRDVSAVFLVWKTIQTLAKIRANVEAAASRPVPPVTLRRRKVARPGSGRAQKSR
jgi:uncharacterized protein YbjT (DUF2867 family)